MLGKGQVDTHVCQGCLGIEPGPGIDAESALRTRMYTFDPSTWAAEEGGSEFRASLGYTVSSVSKVRRGKKVITNHKTRDARLCAFFLKSIQSQPVQRRAAPGSPQRRYTKTARTAPVQSHPTSAGFYACSQNREELRGLCCLRGGRMGGGIPPHKLQSRGLLLFASFSCDLQLFSVVRIDCFSNKKDFKEKEKGGSQCAFSVSSLFP